MVRTYKVLNQQIFEAGDYKLVPIRHEDRYDIMTWRNEQIEILRQQEVLTSHEQDNYFENVVNSLFLEEYPKQVLFSFLKNDVLVGYGGLVHIDWESSNAEISFLLQTSLMDVANYLHFGERYFSLIVEVAKEMNLKKIFTFGYDLADYRFKPLYRNGFELEAYLHEHTKINGQYYGVRIYGYSL